MRHLLRVSFSDLLVVREIHAQFKRVLAAPVRIDQMNISGDLVVANDSTTRQMQRQLSQEEEEEGAGPNHRLQQYYTAPVIINGSLTVRNLQRDTNTTSLQLGNQSLLHEDLGKQYLLLHADQVSGQRSATILTQLNPIFFTRSIYPDWHLVMRR